MRNRLIDIQNMLYTQMEKLNDKNIIENGLCDKEFQLCNVLSKTATTYIKAVQTQIKIKEITGTANENESDLLRELGIVYEN